MVVVYKIVLPSLVNLAKAWSWSSFLFPWSGQAPKPTDPRSAGWAGGPLTYQHLAFLAVPRRDFCFCRFCYGSRRSANNEFSTRAPTALGVARRSQSKHGAGNCSIERERERDRSLSLSLSISLSLYLSIYLSTYLPCACRSQQQRGRGDPQGRPDPEITQGSF